ILFFMVIGFIGIFLGVGVGAGYFASLVKDEPIRTYASMEKDIYNIEETSKLYFANEVYIGDVRSDLHREKVALEDISETLINAVIATEDEYFEEHNGVVPKAIVRAMVQEVMNSDIKSGGSTLTQQIIKNQILTNEVYIGDVRSDLHREKVALEDISETLINAVIATEDEYFEEHNGVVPKAIVRAMVQEVMNSDIKSGGSTLTQQIIKNQILTNEVSFERK